VKFTPPGGRVHVGLRRSGPNIAIVVADTGKGISPEFLPHVFERFRQEDGSTTRANSGLGLGLGIVRHVVELHGGSVEVASAGAGRGSTFTITLPAGAAAVQSARDAVEAPARPQGEAGAPLGEKPLRGVRVLVVEDEPDARELIGVVLETSGASATMTSSAAEAMASLTEHPPDLLVSDIGLVDEDGYSLIGRVRALGPADPRSRIPAIALSAYARPEDRLRAIEAGFDLHMAKPVEPSELIAAVARMSPDVGSAAGAPAPG
jgi:CheY-like chemotaxis protein